ncbi:rod shape-determining protein MreD, partial [Vibrio cholerae]
MLSSEIKGRMVILASFLLALILHSIPWPGTLDLFGPPF